MQRDVSVGRVTTEKRRVEAAVAVEVVVPAKCKAARFVGGRRSRGARGRRWSAKSQPAVVCAWREIRLRRCRRARRADRVEGDTLMFGAEPCPPSPPQ